MTIEGDSHQTTVENVYLIFKIGYFQTIHIFYNFPISKIVEKDTMKFSVKTLDFVFFLFSGIFGHYPISTQFDEFHPFCS
jgi:hypothetical protein